MCRARLDSVRVQMKVSWIRTLSSPTQVYRHAERNLAMRRTASAARQTRKCPGILLHSSPPLLHDICCPLSMTNAMRPPSFLSAGGRKIPKRIVILSLSFSPLHVSNEDQVVHIEQEGRESKREGGIERDWRSSTV